MDEYSSYVGLDVHKDTIAVAVALARLPQLGGHEDANQLIFLN